MGVTLSHVTANHVRAVIARGIAGEAPGPPAVGSIVLRAHQREAVARVEAAFAEFGGAVLADATGLGKTYVALAVARTARQPLIVGPAVLKDMWTASAQAVGRSIPFVSMESLSRASAPRASAMPDPDLVIVDEAHHARNPATARYRALAQLTARARVLLMTATPVHNTRRDLLSLLALFLGARAEAADSNALMRCVIRRTVTRDGPALPTVSRPRLLSIPDDEARMNAIVALPPPVPPSDGGDGGILLIYSLLRRWASSQGALVESLRGRLARATALIDGLEAGRYPSSRELAAWSYADGAMQLAFPELIVNGAMGRAPAAELATTVTSHVLAVRALLDQLRRSHDLDECRARHITTIRASHAGAKIVAFSQYAETVAALFGHLRNQRGVAALTASGARIAGGMLSRREAVARFAPEAQGARAARTADAIDLLLTTDLLSEGVNLQDASVVVHLDLPWTPARLEQRVGRAARIGSRHERVIVYSMQPPASAERLVRVEERLRAKLGITARTVGVVGTILPHLSLHDAAPGHTSPSELRERLAAILDRWASHREIASMSAPRPDDPTVVAAVLSLLNGFVALVEDDGALRLVAALGNDDPSDDPERVLRAVIIAEGPDTHVDDSGLQRVVRALERWHRVGRDRRDITLDGALHARARRAVVDRIAAIARRTPRHLRPGIAELAASARRTATARYGAGAERVLDQLASAELPDEAWLRAIGTFGQLHAPDCPSSPAPGTSVRIRAILLLVPVERETPAAPVP